MHILCKYGLMNSRCCSRRGSRVKGEPGGLIHSHLHYT